MNGKFQLVHCENCRKFSKVADTLTKIQCYPIVTLGFESTSLILLMNNLWKKKVFRHLQNLSEIKWTPLQLTYFGKGVSINLRNQLISDLVLIGKSPKVSKNDRQDSRILGNFEITSNLRKLSSISEKVYAISTSVTDIFVVVMIIYHSWCFKVAKSL